MAPYWLLDSPYSLVSVKIVLAAGNRHQDDALHQPGRVDDRPFGFRGHLALPASPALGSVRWVLSPDTAVCPPGRVLPSPSRDEAALSDGYRGILTEVLSALQEP